MPEGNFALSLLKVILALALVGGLSFAGWRIYRALPNENAGGSPRAATYGRGNTPVSIVMGSGLSGAVLNSPVELYPFDLTAAQREFQTTPQLGKTFDDFLARRMRGVTPVPAPTDSHGRAAANLGAGNWWLRATASLNSGETIEWRLPFAVSGNEQTVELTLENAYEKTKKF
jgi:hypothetical protein